MKAMSFPVRWLAAALSALFLVGGVVTPLCAQSLAELAKKEEERRRAIKEPSKTYTNKDLVNLPPATASPPPETSKPATGATPATGDAAKGAEGDKGKDKPKDAPARDQKYWSGRMKELQTQLQRDQSFAEALQSRINALTTDFVARDDPAQKAVIGQNRQKALVELDRLKQAIVNDKKAIVDLEDEARKASVPPGWLR
jgi:hypothetical protein